MMLITYRNLFLTVIACFLLSIAKRGYGQQAHTVGVEVQGYRSGVISVLRGGLGINPRQELAIRAGYNVMHRENLGKHDHEEGSGPGFGLNYRYYAHHNLDGFFLGARADLWFLDIDWKGMRHFECPPNAGCVIPANAVNTVRKGESNVTVFQPTIEVGYNVLGGRSNWLIAPTASFGWEINVHTSGEDIDEGAILLAGLNIAYLF